MEGCESEQPNSMRAGSAKILPLLTEKSED